MDNNIKVISRVLLIMASGLLLASIFVPIWRIELDAPQYPEGLMMQIHANKLGGQTEIINGLNHYIGMDTLHTEDFVEFTVLPYIIGFFSLLMLVAAIMGNKKVLYFSFYALLVFGVVSMADFWRWEYNYGHNLDPNAAIIVPGMSYQPPLIGFKQLLNFGAYSIPDIGGWLIVGSGFLVLLACLIESKILNRLTKKNQTLSVGFIIALSVGLQSCGTGLAEPIKLNTDKCDYCQMNISDGRFGAELITKKGRAFKFDDIQCMIGYKNENSSTEVAAFYVHDYTQSNVLIDATSAVYVDDENLRSPMGGNKAAFVSQGSAEEYVKSKGGNLLKWTDLAK